MHQVRRQRPMSILPESRFSRRRLMAGGLGLGLAGLVSGAAGVAAGPRAGAGLTHAARASENPGTFTALMAYGLEDLDPHSTYGAYGPLFTFGVYERLIKYGAGGVDAYEPVLAESWEVSEDKTTYTFRLAPDVRFHDGVLCDAQAVRSSFARLLGLGLGPGGLIARFVADPNQIEALDAVTLRFNLGTPQPLFLAALASAWGPYAVSPKAVADNRSDDDPWAHEWFTSNAAGTGPYQLAEFAFNERIVLTRFGGYRRGWTEELFDQVVLRVVPESATRRQLIERNEVDALTYALTPDDVEALKGTTNVQVHTYDTTRVNWAIMNAVKLPREARQGLSFAFPYEDVASGLYKGLLKRSGPIPSTVRASDPNVFLYQTDLARARELLLAAGLSEGDSFEYVVEASSPLEQAAAQLFQANLAQIGFDLSISALDGAAIEGIVFGDAPVEERPDLIGSWAWWPDYNDPWSHLAPNFLAAAVGAGGGNAGGWVNERFEQLMAEAEHYTDETRLVELMAEAQNILTEQDPPVIYQGQVQSYTVLAADIQGFSPNPFYLETYPFYDLRRA
jgi:peptide/nickel transport system substrate-binding protein